MRFYVYNDDTNRKTRIHTGRCSYCNEGQGINAQLRTNKSRWHGPYATLLEAQTFAKSLKKKHTRTCKYCLDDRDPVSAW